MKSSTYPTWNEIVWFEECTLLNIHLAFVEAVLFHHDFSGDLTRLGLILENKLV